MELGVYVHIPFCAAKCKYCDFLSYPGQEKAKKDEYLHGLREETRLYLKNLPRFTATNFYVGGGTPTCLSGGQLFLLLDFLGELLQPASGAEITVEANPATLDREKLRALKKGGCTRLSLGVQSFHDGELHSLGRIHSRQDVYNTYKLARRMGFSNISLDLMYGLPGQELTGWRESLREAVGLEPDHLSLYQLAIEPGTPFYDDFKQGLLQEFEQDRAGKMYEEAIEFLVAQGFHHYEISNFARRGCESKHNQMYWQNREYLGLGAGAAGYLQRVRYTNQKNLTVYSEMVAQGVYPIGEKEKISTELAMKEFMFLGLRLLAGVDKNSFRERYGITMQERFGKVIQPLKAHGLLHEEESRLSLTRRGLYIANEVFMAFL